MSEDPDLDCEPEYLAERRFFDFADPSGLPARDTLSAATGSSPPAALHPTGLVRDAAAAWDTPYAELTCEQVRLLLGQKMALAVLARPILSFIARCPRAAITNYAGEMERLVLAAAAEFLTHERAAFRAWLAGDFSWMEDTFGSSRPLLREAKEALASARRIAGCDL
ncbi:MAG TPA: hypothetical protein VF552_02495 [Allosphingosinicella sp.]